jgi:hypothetical protein
MVLARDSQGVQGSLLRGLRGITSCRIHGVPERQEGGSRQGLKYNHLRV